MSINFDGHQYEQAFTTYRIQNYELSRLDQVSRHPRPRRGYTRPIADCRGHICSGQQRSRESPWGSFVGTWEMPRRIPGSRVTTSTARNDEEVSKGQLLKDDFQAFMGGASKPRRSVPPLPVLYDNGDKRRVVGMVCESVHEGQGHPTDEIPCMKVEHVHSQSNWPRAVFRTTAHENTKFPKIKMPRCIESPVQAVHVTPGIGDTNQFLTSDIFSSINAK